MNTACVEPVQELLGITLDHCKQSLNRGDFPSAMQLLNRAVHLSPGNPELLSHRGRVAIFLKDFDSARRDFVEALQFNPRCAAAYSGLARQNFECGLAAEAEAAASRALEIDPTDDDAQAVLRSVQTQKRNARPSSPQPHDELLTGTLPRTGEFLLEMSKRLPSGDKWSASPALAGKILSIVERVRPYTMVPDEAVVRTIELTLAAAATASENDVIAECGTWKGGSSLAMILAQQEILGEVKHPVWMFDSFEGLPEITGDDGKLAVEWQEQSHLPEFFNKCAARLEDVLAMMKREGIEESNYRIFKGWFNQTVAPAAEELDRCGSQLALLRLDGDWYESTRDCLNAMFPKLRKGAPCIVDDYYAWDGCALALHEYFGRHRIAARLRTMPLWQGAFFFNKVRESLNDI
jgi:O-methyltransferase